MCSIFTVGVSRGMTITTGTPSRWPWYESPCAWLPADAAMTPRAFSPSVSCSSLFSAPRSLKAAVNCRFSNFTHTSAPEILDKVREKRQGVRSMWPCRREAAARMSSRVTLMGADP